MQRLHEQRGLGLLISLARRRLKQEIWRRIRPLGFTPPQFGVLLTMKRLGRVSLSELADELCIDSPTASRIVIKLEHQGYLRVRSDPDDRRRSQLDLTASGKRLAASFLEVKQQFEAELEAGLTATERSALLSGLEKVIRNMERAAEQSVLAEAPARARGTRR